MLDNRFRVIYYPNRMTQTLEITMPEPGKLGPAMRALNERQRAFVIAYFAHGNRDQAAVDAGYSGQKGDGVNRERAHWLTHNAKVQAAIQEYAKTTALIEMLPQAMISLARISKFGEDKDQLKAVEMITNRTGVHAVTESKITVEHTDRLDQLKLLIRAAIEEGKDPRAYIGESPDVTDADFAMVEAEMAKLPAPTSLDGLEDLV